MPKKRTATKCTPHTAKQRLRLQASAGQAELQITESVPRFAGVAYSGGLMYPRQASRGGVVVDLNGLRTAAPQLLAAREHDPTNICGAALSITNDRRQLTCSGVLGGNDPTVTNLARAAKSAGRPAIFPLSVDLDFHTDDVEFVRPGQTVIVNGQQFTGPLPIVRRSLLRRIDFVSKGGDPKAYAKITASAGEGTTMNFEQFLASLGVDQAGLSPEQLAKYQQLYQLQSGGSETETEDSANTSPSGMTAADGDADVDLDALANQASDAAIRRMRGNLAAESARISGIEALCKKYGDPEFKVNGQTVSLQAHAIEQGWDLTRTELEALRESRPQAPAGQVRSLQASADALVAAQLMDIGLDVEQQYNRRLSLEAGRGMADFLFLDINSDAKQRTLEAAHGMRGMSSMDFAATALEIAGHHVPRGSRGVLQTLEAAGSSSSFSNIISTTTKSAIVISFEQTPDSTLEWCEEDTGKDFLSEQVVGLKQPGGSLDLLSNGTATEDHLSDKGESIQINRFAKQMNLDEQTLINDQLGQIMKMMAGAGGWGVKARNTRPDLVYSLLLANGAMSDGVAFFHSDHRNVITSSELSNSTLGSAIEKLLLAYEQGADGSIAHLAVTPTHVIVPPALKHTLQTNLDSDNLGAIAASQVPLSNPIREYGLKSVTDPRLQLGLKHKLTGATLNGSSTTWWLVSADAPPVLVRYLQATGRVPMIRTTQLTQGRWGVNIDCKFDIGGCLQRFQTAVKATA